MAWNALRWPLVAIAVLIVPIPTANAQRVCGPREGFVKKLYDGYAESRSGMGLSAGGAVVELFTAETGTWTILITYPPVHRGAPVRTCVIGSGEGWEMQSVPDGPGRPDLMRMARP